MPPSTKLAPEVGLEPTTSGLTERNEETGTRTEAKNSHLQNTKKPDATGSASLGQVVSPSQPSPLVPIRTEEPLASTPIPRSDNAIEAALARALERASEAGQWEVVAQLARELEARRRGR